MQYCGPLGKSTLTKIQCLAPMEAYTLMVIIIATIMCGLTMLGGSDIQVTEAGVEVAGFLCYKKPDSWGGNLAAKVTVF